MKKHTLPATRHLPPATHKWLLAVLLLLALTGCERPIPDVTPVPTLVPQAGAPRMAATPTLAPGRESAPTQPLPTLTPEPDLPTYQGTPTPDPTRPGTTDDEGTAYLTHNVGYGESLGYIAQLYSSSVDELLALNDLENAEFLAVGQTLRVPGAAAMTGPSVKVIPDSELVYGPAGRDFDVRAVAKRHDGYLLAYEEEVEGQMLDGPAIVQLVANRFSVNPRLLLAALEYQSGWLTQAYVVDDGYPLGKRQQGYEGLFKQLNWTADQLNWGYYGRAEGGITSVRVGETRVAFAPDINDGTAGMQHWLAAYDGVTVDGWLEEVGPAGFFATYSRLFGNPFAYTVDPLVPGRLEQPSLALPWADGEWFFTGGPHGGWGSGSAWAAVDFAPSHDQMGCYETDAWVTAVSGGVVVRSDFGAVVVDMDGDGYAGTGWAITYMHLEPRDRISAGTTVQTGDRLGHPSCEGGFSNGTHVHVARTFNGRWIAADGEIPLVMGGWTTAGLGREYDGLLTRGDEVKEACQCREEMNTIPAGEPDS